ncbi:MAG: hypothetical protein ACFB4I_01645 [Cyanophyceae cyanobacterium]
MKKFIIFLSLLVAAPAQASTILNSDFSSQAETLGQGWQLGSTQVDETTGELFSPQGAGSFAEATFDFDSPLDLDEGSVTVTWVERWVSKGMNRYTERAKTFVDLDIFKRSSDEYADVLDQLVGEVEDEEDAKLRNQQTAFEDFELKANIRPPSPNGNAQEYYNLYLDPGFQIEHVADALLEPPSEQTNVTNQLFSYRMRAEKQGGSVLATLEYLSGDWQSLESDDLNWTTFERATNPGTPDYFSGENSDLPLRLDIENDLFGKDSFESLQLRFGTPGGFAFFDSVQVEQATATTGSGENNSNPQSVPESGSLLGILGAVSLGLAGWRKSANVKA